MEDTKKYKWLFVLKNPKQGRIKRVYDYSVGRWYSEPDFSGQMISFVGTNKEIGEFYDKLIEESICVQDDYNLGIYEESNS